MMPQTDTITNNAIMPQSINWMPFLAASSPPILARYDIKPQKKTTIAMVMKRKMTPFKIPSTRLRVLSIVTCAKAMKGKDSAERARADTPIIRARINIVCNYLIKLSTFMVYDGWKSTTAGTGGCG